MIKRIATRFVQFAAILIVPFLLMTGCNKKADRTSFLLGTICRIQINGGDRSDLDAAFNRIRQIESRMTRNKDTSEIRKIASAGGDGFKVSPGACQVIRKALDFGHLSGGLFDVTIAPVVDVWGFGNNDVDPHLPSATTLKQTLPLVDYRQIHVQEDCRVTTGPGQRIDLGGIAKGYAADEAAKVLQKAGVKSALINLGGNIFVLGKKDNGKPWKFGIQDPLQPTGTMMGTIEIDNGALVTSGIYERFVEENGKKYHHILDPRTGYPVENNLAGVSITAPSGLDADALSTVVFMLGIDKGCELLAQFPDTGAIFISKNGEITTYGIASARFNLTNEDYTVIERR